MLASSFIHNGVINGASIVVTAVTVTDSPRFARAMYAITFDARPLDVDPIKMIPAAISGSKWNNFARANPTSGITVKWHTIPTRTPRGCRTTPVKSFRLICGPIPTITA